MEIKDLFSFAWGKIEPQVESQVIQAADVLYRDKQVIEEVYAHLLKKYGNEVYYNDLDSYITSNHVIELLIQSIRGKSNVQPRIVRTFKTENARKFLRYNPRFKGNKVVSSRIPDIFEEVFDIVHSKLLILDPHSDLGKIQRDLRITGESLSDEHQGMNAKLDSIQKTVSSMQSVLTASGISDTATENMGTSSEIIDSYTKTIKEIESEYQNKHQYHAALSRYYALLQNIVTALAGHSQEQINALICTINCNIALCQSNLGLPQKAFESLSAIPDETASKSKVYHFVYALIYIQQNDIDNYSIALDHVNAALAIDSNYHNAFSSKQFLLAYIHPDRIESIVQDLDAHYSVMVSEGSEHGKLAEYYQFRGLINMHADKYSDAIEDFHHALEHGCEPMTTKLNIAVTMYAEASESVPRDRRLLVPPINQKIMIKAADAFKEVIALMEGNADFADIRRRAVSLYVSACSSLGKRHDLSPVNDYIYEGQDYEQLRGLLLGSSEKLTESQLSLLSSDDRLFFTVRDMMERNDAEACRKYIAELVDKEEQRIPATVFHILLQVCLITESSDCYWKYRKEAVSYGICGDLLDSMDACAYELEGDIPHAKDIFDRISVSSADDNILENTLRFFLRNKFKNDAKALFVRMHEMIISSSMYMKDVEPFYREANRFFIAEQDDIIPKILLELPEGLVSPKCKSQLLASFYSATNDSGKLYECMNDLDCAHDEFTNAYSMALCAARLFKYDEALKICYDLEKRMPNNEEKIKLLWLISDILLLNNDKESSFSWAKKAHDLTNQNPYDRSHQAYFSRAFRCNHHEAISDIMEYQKEHPVVVNWIKAFSISEDDGDVVTSLKNALNEFGPNHDDYEELEMNFAKLYKQGIVPIHTVWERHNGALWRLFDFASKNKLNIALGNTETLVADLRKVRKNVVIDALTLILMAYHDCLGVLDSFEHVYVNYRSIATIQQEYLSGEYPLISDILSWLKSAENVIFEADGFIDEENQIVQLFSANFMACCNIAATVDAPFLYCDVIARKLQALSGSGISPDVDFVSIPAVCNKFLALNPQRLSDVLYGFLKDTTFISFRPETILYQIRKQNYVVSKELIAPFMFCDTSCDMHSFANVYLAAIKELHSENLDAAYALACIILEDALRIWRKGTYYRLMEVNYPNLESVAKAEAINQYVWEVLQGIEETFENMQDNLACHFNALVSVTEYTSA